MRAARRPSGFTMIEILVALSLAGILIAGAFQIHAVFNVQSMRQKQVDDMQQSLRIAMQTIERTIRSSGSGMVNGHMQIKPGCTNALDIFRVQYYNSLTTWPPPVNNATTASNSGFDTATPGTTLSPDVLRVVTAINQGSAMVSTTTANTATILSPVKMDGLIVINDFALFVNTLAGTSKTAMGVLRQLTASPTSTAISPNFQTIINFNSTGGTACANTNNETPTPLMPLAATLEPVRFFRSETYFKIIPPVTALDTPKLSVMVVPIGTTPPTTGWNMITDDIEDMQIALIMNDGRVCNDHDEPYPLWSTIYATAPATLPGAFTSCDPSQAAAVRVTLTARTNTLSQGSTSQQSQQGGYEDVLSTTATDGRLRRSLTSEMTLRN